MTIRILIALILLTCPAFGQADIRYYVRDEIKTDKLDYTIDRDCVVYTWGGPKELPNLQYHVSISVDGCIQPSFTYEEENYNKRFSFKEYDELTNIVKKANLLKLGFIAGPSCLFGSLVIDGKDHDFTTPLGNPERDKLQANILSFLDRVAPKKAREIITRTIESDFAPPRDVTIEELLRFPSKYDGKRVRVTGYYYSESEESNFSEHKGDDIEQSLSLDGSSTFAKDADLHWVDEGHATVEGTFFNGPGGHWGEWPGEIQRLTRFIPLDPPPPPAPPKPFTAQSTKG